MIEIIPTCVPVSADDVKVCAYKIARYTDQIHIDVDDGIFTSAVTWPYTSPGILGDFDLADIGALRAEVHLMTKNPLELGERFIALGAQRIIGHMEAFSSPQEIHEALKAWRGAGAQAGLAALMQTPLEKLNPFISECDVVLLMTIASVGTQGIPYDSNSPLRVGEFHAKHPEVLIAVDGGVSEKNISDLARVGARRFSVGSALSKSSNQPVTYKHLKTLAESAPV